MADKGKRGGEEDISGDAIAQLSSDIAPGLKIIIGIGQRAKDSILDYVFGAAILGLIPIYGPWVPEVRIILLTALNLKMIWNVGRFWGNYRGQGSLALMGSLFSVIGSVILAVLAWLIIFGIGLFIPLVDSLARAIAYSVLTWNIGMVASRYYYSPQALDITTLQKALKFQREQKNR